jgi:hypothetical protein
MTETIVRCPYCVVFDVFRPMFRNAEGGFVCKKCGHIAMPGDDDFQCSCGKCVQLQAFDYCRCR